MAWSFVRPRSAVMRSRFIVLVSVLVAGALAVALVVRRRTPRPSIVLVSMDTLRADRLGCYGNRLPTSPAIDRFRADAVLFTQAISHAPATLASHASIMTSLLPQHHGAWGGRNTPVAEKLVTLAEVLRAAGYATASFNGGIRLDAVYGLGQGFDVYDSVRPGRAEAHVLSEAIDRFAHAVERGLAWIDANSARPFFLFLHAYEVHSPYTPDLGTLAQFDGDYAGTLPQHISVDLIRSINAGQVRIDDRDRRHIQHAYDAEVRSADAAFGQLVEGLRARGLYDGSMIVFTSDHGEEFGEHGMVGWHSHTLYDELLHVPLIIKRPRGAGAGTTVAAQVRLIDVAPTILREVGVDVPEPFAGVALLSGPNPVAPPAVSGRNLSDGQTSASIRTERWKLYEGRLYDLAADPGETTDVAAAHPEEVGRLTQALSDAVRERSASSALPIVPDEELTKRLRAMGYIE